MKQLLVIVLVVLLSVAVIPIAQADCPADLEAAEELMEEATCAECPPTINCEEECRKQCGWVALVKDETFRAAVIGSTLLVIGGIASIFITGSG